MTANDAPIRVLLVEDERSIREPLTDYLGARGFAVSAAADATEARTLLAALGFDIAICDIMMPGEDGLSLTRHIQGHLDIPVILLTARTEEADRVVGLELGADDYVTKPFSPRELSARIGVVMRRIARGGKVAADGSGGYAFGEWVLRPGERALVGKNGVSVSLSSAEFELLQVFVRHPRQVMSRDRLLDLTGGEDGEAFDRAIDNRSSRLRKKIEVDPRDPQVIKTVWGGGYMLAPPVMRIEGRR